MSSCGDTGCFLRRTMMSMKPLPSSQPMRTLKCGCSASISARLPFGPVRHTAEASSSTAHQLLDYLRAPGILICCPTTCIELAAPHEQVAV